MEIVYALILVVATVQEMSCWKPPIERPQPCGIPAYPRGPPIPPRPQQSVHIIDGDLANPHSWPWMVFLQFTGQYGADCGAALVPVCYDVSASDIIVTAAHCIYDWEWDDKGGHSIVRNMKSGKAYFGTHDKTMQSVERELDSRFTHRDGWNPQPDRVLRGEDLAVLKLKQPVNFTREIRPICLAKPDPNGPQYETPKLYWTCFYVGWGLMNKTHTSTVLRQASAFKRHTPEECFRFLAASDPSWPQADMRKYIENTTCIEPIKLQLRKFASNGDSGGPLFCRPADQDRWMLFGILNTELKNDQNETILNLAKTVAWGDNLKWMKDKIKALSKIPVKGKCSKEMYEI